MAAAPDVRSAAERFGSQTYVGTQYWSRGAAGLSQHGLWLIDPGICQSLTLLWASSPATERARVGTLRCRRQLEVPKGLDAMKLGLSNFQPVAASEIIEQEVFDLGDLEQLTAPMIESDRVSATPVLRQR